jgi:hypothetical protein
VQYQLPLLLVLSLLLAYYCLFEEDWSQTRYRSEVAAAEKNCLFGCTAAD